jgi:hypothetical protein
VPEIDDSFPRAWIEFEDPADKNQRIRADLTWLTSRWHCIYGQGCMSIESSIPHGGCCTFGAHFADEDDEQRVGEFVSQLTRADWEMRPEILGAESPHPSDDLQYPGVADHEISTSDWVETDSDGERKTRIEDGACIFLNGPSFAAGPGCALHVLAERLGKTPVLTKPDVCWQLPIRRDYETSHRADGVETTVVVITEYVRGMWGEGGHDLDWYCSSNTAAHTAKEPVYLNSRAELVAMVGAEAYELLGRYCANHERSRSLLAVSDITNQSLAPHPADPAPADPTSAHSPPNQPPPADSPPPDSAPPDPTTD